ncbi:MAG: hypothetical protein IT449_01410 [Phycisphaerales bacterium]|nr:hypothetical protein [Phycisphaerales bacterium]
MPLLGDIGEPPSLPGYRLIWPIGRGGFGEVWLAEEMLTGVHRAAKLIPLLSASAGSITSSRELEGVRAFKNAASGESGLLQIETVSQTLTHLYYITELADPLEPLPGRAPASVARYRPKTLASVLEQRRGLPAEEALRIVEHVLTGLTALHDRGLVHFDVKPSNVIFVNGEAKLADPGLVGRVSAHANRSGTPGYVPPDAPSDLTTDLYAAGKLLYTTVTGIHPTQFPDLPGDRPRPDESARTLRKAIRIANKAAHPDPSKRYRRTREMLAAVDAAPRESRRRSSIAALLGAAVLGVLAFSAVYWRTLIKPIVEDRAVNLKSIVRDSDKKSIGVFLSDDPTRQRSVYVPGGYHDARIFDAYGTTPTVVAILSAPDLLTLYELHRATAGDDLQLRKLTQQSLQVTPPEKFVKWAKVAKLPGILLVREFDGVAGDELVVKIEYQEAASVVLLVTRDLEIVGEFWYLGWPAEALACNLDSEPGDALVLRLEAVELPESPAPRPEKDHHAAVLVLDPRMMTMNNDAARWSINPWLNPVRPHESLLGHGYVTEAYKSGPPNAIRDQVWFARENGQMIVYGVQLPQRFRIEFSNGWNLVLDGALRPEFLEEAGEWSHRPPIPDPAAIWRRTWPPPHEAP